MDNLEFRLREEDGKVVGYEKHIKINGNIEIIHRGRADEYGTNMRLLHIPHTSKEMYTGRRDVSGIEIYENDTVYHTAYGSRAIYQGMVVWDRGRSAFIMTCEKRVDSIYGTVWKDTVLMANHHITVINDTEPTGGK